MQESQVAVVPFGYVVDGHVATQWLFDRYIIGVKGIQVRQVVVEPAQVKQGNVQGVHTELIGVYSVRQLLVQVFPARL